MRQVGKAGADFRQELGEYLVRCVLAGMDAFQVADQFGGHPASGLPDDFAAPENE